MGQSKQNRREPSSSSPWYQAEHHDANASYQLVGFERGISFSWTWQVYTLILNSSNQSRIRLAIDEVFVISRETQASAASHSFRNDQAFHDLRTQSRLLTGISDDNAELRNAVQSTISLLQTGQSLQHATQTSTNSPCSRFVIGMRAYMPVHQRSICRYNCKCDCHQPHQVRTPQLFNRVLGALFVGYSGYPFGTLQRCTNAYCQRDSGFRAQIKYFFPLWLLEKMIQVLIMIAPTHEPCVSLTVRVVVQSSAALFHFALTDDCEGLRRILSNGSARPNDLSYYNGSTAIMVSGNSHVII